MLGVLTKDAMVQAWQRLVYILSLTVMLAIIAGSCGAGAYVAHHYLDPDDPVYPGSPPLVYEGGKSLTVYRTEELDALIKDAEDLLGDVRRADPSLAIVR